MKAIRILLIPGIILFIHSFSFAQENIVTSRPTQSIGAWTLPANSFQFEQGFTYGNDTLTLDGFFRLSFSSIGEIRVLTYYGSNDVNVEAKAMLMQPDDNKPGVAMKVSLGTNLVVNDFRLIVTKKLTDRFEIVGNVGQSLGTWYGIALLGVGLNDKMSTWVEAYYEGGYQQYNSGLTFALNSETQLDINFGLMDYEKGYIGVGFARRFKYDHLVH
ncbi:MAG: hypothetical protein ABFS32_20480 [Bacteroidota bacterium]